MYLKTPLGNISILLLFLVVSVSTCAFTKDSFQFPLKIHRGHLFTVDKINDSISSSILLESGFPEIVFNLDFAEMLSNKFHLNLRPSTDNSKIALWGSNASYPVKYILEDTIQIFGTKEKIRALVVDFSPILEWQQINIVFPIYYTNGYLHLNIKDGNMHIFPNDTLFTISKDYHQYTLEKDEKLNALYCKTELGVAADVDSFACINGNFLLDLGNANFLVLNRNKDDIETFLKCRGLVELDTSRYMSNPDLVGLKVFETNTLHILDIELKDAYLIALKFKKEYAVNSYTAILGIPFLKMFDVFIDIKQQKLYLKKNKEK